MADTTFTNGVTLTDAGWYNDINDFFYTYMGGQSGGSPGTCTFDLKFTDATYDIGKSGATRPRDLFISRAGTVGTTLTVGTSVTIAGGSALANYTTWANYTPTVTLVGGAGNTVPVYSTNSGRWMQIGKQVFVEVYLSGDGGNEGAGTGNFSIALPVAVGASAASGTDYVPCGRGVNDTSRFALYAQATAGASVMALAYWATATSFPLFTGADQNNATRSVRVQYSYEVD